MTKPTLSEVTLNFFRATKDKELSHREAEKFWSYHESRGWKVGKVAMKNWQAAAVTWRRNMAERSNNISTPRQIQNQAPADLPAGPLRGAEFYQ